MASPIICEIIKLTIDASSTLAGRSLTGGAAFSHARKIAVDLGVKEQYYGEDNDDKKLLFWVLNWDKAKGVSQSKGFRDAVNGLDSSGTPESWYIPFNDTSDLKIGLTSPLVELCFLHESGKTPKSEIADSLEKTFTDCYQAEGFVGGSWGTAINDERMSWYILGWETRQHHAAYLTTTLFWEEINKLMPHMDGGKGHFMKMIHNSTDNC